MKNVLITGLNGKLSCSVAQWLSDKYGYTVSQISLKNDEWKTSDFSGFDVAVHVAGIVPKAGVEQQQFYKINYELTEKFANKCKADGVKQFIYISSMSVYGIEPQMNIKKGTVTESTDCNPTSDYGKSKLMAENCLQELEDENFKVAIIRVPSIYGKGKTEYLDQYRHLNDKFSKLPRAFLKHYKSIIYIDNLCELIGLIIKNTSRGVFCPDDGEISAFKICKAIDPNKHTSALYGVIIKALRFSDRIRDYFGAVCYSPELSDIFNGKYRIADLSEAVKNSYEK